MRRWIHEGRTAGSCSAWPWAQVLPVREDAEGRDDGRLVRLNVTGVGDDSFRLEVFAADRAVELDVTMVLVGLLGRAEGDIEGGQQIAVERTPTLRRARYVGVPRSQDKNGIPVK